MSDLDWKFLQNLLKREYHQYIKYEEERKFLESKSVHLHIILREIENLFSIAEQPVISSKCLDLT